MVFPSWPWTNFHEENQDWLIKTVKACESAVSAVTTKIQETLDEYIADHVPKSVWIKNVNGTLSYGFGDDAGYDAAAKIIDGIMTNHMGTAGQAGVIFYRAGNIVDGNPAILPTAYNVHPDMHDTYYTVVFGDTITVQMHQNGTITVV